TDIRVEEITGLSAINADAERIKQVLLNVLLNSVDAASCREKPVITIRMSGTSGYVNIVIRDNGTGIKKEDLARVKEPLFTNKPQGSGLGLAISEKIMKAHDGAIIIDSDGESYTEVSVIIPAFV
ncbi:MAG TPA: ATP-binding protein, partial [Candidatus Goldiibacteriota bacterium]|nr:ATP-binding protein [Candidatus Goldiibacteriota bacterium]